MKNETQELRFRFGQNWRSFLSLLNENRIKKAEAALQDLCVCDDFSDKRFLDIGSGSGLFSLAARRLGAQVVSFDYDSDSVACTAALQEKFFPGDPNWKVMQGSVLDADFVRTLQEFDIVYSWGVLHHTGNMHNAFDNCVLPVKVGGKLVVAVYNDQGALSAFWIVIKKAYVTNILWRGIILASFVPLFALSALLSDAKHLRNPIARYRSERDRGMSPFHDWIDWLGGYPFEVATEVHVINYFKKFGFTLLKRISAGRKLGCNQFCFIRDRG